MIHPYVDVTKLHMCKSVALNAVVVAIVKQILINFNNFHLTISAVTKNDL